MKLISKPTENIKDEVLKVTSSNLMCQDPRRKKLQSIQTNLFPVSDSSGVDVMANTGSISLYINEVFNKFSTKFVSQFDNEVIDIAPLSYLSCNHDRVLRFADFVNISQFINSSMSSSIRQWVRQWVRQFVNEFVNSSMNSSIHQWARQFVNEFVNSSTSSSIIVRIFKLNWRILYELPLTNWRTHWQIDEFIDEPANSLTNWWNRWRTDQLIYKLTIPLMKWKTHWRNDANSLFNGRTRMTTC